MCRFFRFAVFAKVVKTATDVDVKNGVWVWLKKEVLVALESLVVLPSVVVAIPEPFRGVLGGADVPAFLEL